MNKEDFLERYAVDRKGTNSLKWDKLEERFGDPDHQLGTREPWL